MEVIVKISYQNDGVVKDDNKILNNIKVVIVPQWSRLHSTLELSDSV